MVIRHSRYGTTSLFFAIGWALLSSTAAVGAAAAEPEARGGLEEIVVTAQRREENLQSVPIAVTALGTEALEEFDVRTIRDVSS